MAYPVRESKSYQRDKDRMEGKRYRNTPKPNPIPVGVVEGVGWTLGSQIMDKAGRYIQDYRRGKKSKLAKELSKKRNSEPGRGGVYGYQKFDSRKSIKPHGNLNVVWDGIDRFIIKDDNGRRFGAKWRTKEDAEKEAIKINRKRNPPSALIVPEVEDKSKEWHGRDNKYVTEVEENETYDTDVAELADLEELGILNPNMRDRFTVSFKRDRPKLCCDGEGHNLEVIGGDQELNIDRVGMEHEGKRLVPLGYCYYIVYETDKHHLEGSNGYPEPYEHYFGEEYYKKLIAPNKFKNSDDWFLELLKEGYVEGAIDRGLLPMIVYNQTDGKILIVGGDYEVQDVGIRN